MTKVATDAGTVGTDSEQLLPAQSARRERRRQMGRPLEGLALVDESLAYVNEVVRADVATNLGNLPAARGHCELGLQVVAEMHRRDQKYPVEALTDLRAQAKRLGLESRP